MAMLPAIFGLKGPELGADERKFFREADPLGFILFQRNCETPEQVRKLTAALRDAVGRADAPILIDQEGGRVQRLKPPHWRAAPPAARFGEIAGKDAARGLEAVRLNSLLVGRELAALGIDVDCAPVLDLAWPGAHEVIGDRAFSANPDEVAALGRAVCDGLLMAGVLPVIKHVPGHGRALVDSHHGLPTVEASRAELERTDFKPFRLLHDMPWGMTAHIVYKAIDADRPATLSAAVIGDVVRGHIGFDGLLVGDDISMKALDGKLADLARGMLAAGCDIVMHCNGKASEMAEIAGAVGPMSAAAAERVRQGRIRVGAASGLDLAAASERLEMLMKA
jgi:beta-N-acetylhexosaminidase